MMLNIFYRPLFIVIILSSLFLSACSSSPTALPQSLVQKKAQQDQVNALAARGFYKSSLGNINYINARQCSQFQLQSHRGSIRFPENSLKAVIDSLDNNFDVIEIDVRITRDDVWVVHHDAKTGRETGTSDNERRKIESIRYTKEWGYLRHRDQNTGLLTNTIPPSFKKLASTFFKYRKATQMLNIEIKSKASIKELQMLDYLAYKYAGRGHYFFSSLEMRNLTRMRDINPDIYLLYIQSPAKASMNKLASDLKRGAGSDPIYQRNKEEIESLQATANRYHRVTRYDSPLRLDKLTKQLKHNFGYVLDIRHYQQTASRLKPAAHAKGIRIATYSINGHAYHEKTLLKQRTRLRPDSVIIDDSIYGFCSVFALPKVAPLSLNNSSSIATLPRDLDLGRLSELPTYLQNKLYPAVGGQLKSISTHVVEPVLQPVIPNFEIGTRQADEDFSLEPDSVVELELREK